MNGTFQSKFLCCYLLATFSLFLLAGMPQIQAQYSPCSTPPPTDAEMANVAAAISNNNTSPETLIWEIPVRVTVFRKNDGSGWNITYDNSFFDELLSNMNTKVAGGPNAFHFFRCGPVNFIDVDQLYHGSLTLSD